MNYRLDKYGNQISALGFGCMRFQRNLGSIDLAEAEREILAAIDGGVNYFDTAYIYPGSESALGEILEKNGLRHIVYIATKLPHYLIRSAEGMEKLSKKENDRCVFFESIRCVWMPDSSIKRVCKLTFINMLAKTLTLFAKFG